MRWLLINLIKPMADLIALPIENGFKINAVCPGCGKPLKMSYAWHSFFTVKKPYDEAYGICSSCKLAFTITLKNVVKPFENSGYLLIKQY